MNQNFKRYCNVLDKNVFSSKVKTQQQQNTKSNTQNSLSEQGIEPGTSRTPVGCGASGPPRQLKVSMVVKIFKCFNAMGRNVNKQSRKF